MLEYMRYRLKQTGRSRQSRRRRRHFFNGRRERCQFLARNSRVLGALVHLEDAIGEVPQPSVETLINESNYRFQRFDKGADHFLDIITTAEPLGGILDQCSVLLIDLTLPGITFLESRMVDNVKQRTSQPVQPIRQQDAAFQGLDIRGVDCLVHGRRRAASERSLELRIT